MAERSIPVRGIAVFEAAARAVSFHAAAEELNLTPSAVSHQIRLLEETLGVKLFERVGRGVTLTAEGAEYARSVRPSIRRLRAATNQIKSRAKKGGALEVVRIEIPPSLAHCWLLPRLAELIAQHRGIDIRVNAQGSHLQGDRLPWPVSLFGERAVSSPRPTFQIATRAAPYSEHGEACEHRTLTGASTTRRSSFAGTSRPIRLGWFAGSG